MHDYQVLLLESGRTVDRICDPEFENGGFCYSMSPFELPRERGYLERLARAFVWQVFHSVTSRAKLEV